MKPSTRLVWLLSLVSLVGYALRSNITIAQEYMAPELGLSMADMGVISAWGFQLSYAVFQIPAGFLGDRYGARLILFLSVLGWGVASLLSGVVTASAGFAFATLFLARVLLGAAQAATYPVAAMAAAQHIPVEQRIGASSIYLAAAMLGSALAPLTLAPLMVWAGWRAVFLVSAGVGLVTAIAWYMLAPRRAEVSGTTRYVPMGQQLREALLLLKQRPLLLLSVSYMLYSATYFVFVFWFFRYLIDGRGFSVLASGMWGSTPYLITFVMAPAVGFLADRMALTTGPAIARRRVAVGCLTVGAALVVVGANLPTAPLAVLTLGLSCGFIASSEATYWTTATALGSHSPGSAGGVLNLMGNLGGVLSIWLVPLMKDAWGWGPMLGFWAALALVAAGLWLAVDVHAGRAQAS